MSKVLEKEKNKKDTDREREKSHDVSDSRRATLFPDNRVGE